MFSRLKGALDSLEESARTTRQNLASPPPQQTPNRSSSSNRVRDGSRARNAATIVKSRERDPGDFESDFSAPNSRSGTPVQKDDNEKEKGDVANGNGNVNGNVNGDGKGGGGGGESGEKEKIVVNSTVEAGNELPADVKAKLRKLEKMETKYTGMAFTCIDLVIIPYIDFWCFVIYRTPSIIPRYAWKSSIDRAI